MSRKHVRCIAVLLALASSSQAETAQPLGTEATRLAQLDEASALWSRYKFSFVEEGRVIARDEGDVTTSEGQSYALLRAVWSGDRAEFDRVLAWTERHLQVRQDRLFAWRFQSGHVVDQNTATDADVDIGLALLLASRRFGAEVYLDKARGVIHDIGRLDVARLGGRLYPTAGNWTSRDARPKIHLGYLAPAAYEEFAKVDDGIAWRDLVATSYDLLHWVYDDAHLQLPPEYLFVDRVTGARYLQPARSGHAADFGYDLVPLFWRLELDHLWHGRPEQEPLRHQVLAFFATEWAAKGALADRYTTGGRALDTNEGLPLYASVATLAREVAPELADEIERHKLRPLWNDALAGGDQPYYLQNWLWFDRATALGEARTFDELLGFLRPFDVQGFLAHLPLTGLLVALCLFLLARVHKLFKAAFIVVALGLCGQYLAWRFASSLNFAESAGPAISITLWAAEAYGLMTVALLWLQVGLGPRRRPLPKAPLGFAPTVDVMIPIYSESLAILESTLVGATAMEYPHKRIHVLDDSHRDEVRALAEEFGARYIQGPKRHAKAGNLNHALGLTDGDLVVVFDTDHIPVRSFLAETVPYFVDAKLGVVQTPHCFYNEDIFQRALGPFRRIGNEQDMFNHGIQSGRDGWGGAFFVGSGAVFRRAAIASVGGFNLLSITEDIHTSQHLHARGWTSAFVDKNLAVGLAAENLAGFIVQRRRWMLGCLQIFFKDNPLLVRGLPLRHRLGYLASLSYFFFPAIRVVFWLTPIWYLLFHWHPLLAEVSVLLAYLVPFLLLRPMITAVLLPGWPRPFWGQVYECVGSFTLFRAMFGLLLPKSLAFKVTPKGVVNDRRAFDWRSSRATLIAVAISVLAIAKGSFEFSYFGIEKEAYFFNLAWAALNLLVLLATLAIAWERPQRRADERVRLSLPASLTLGGQLFALTTLDMSLGGVALLAPGPLPTAAAGTLEVAGLTLPVAPIYQETCRRGVKLAMRFAPLAPALRRALIKELFTRPETWARRHEERARFGIVAAALFFIGLVKCALPQMSRRRLAPRSLRLRWLTLVNPGAARRFLQRDVSAGGLALLSWRRPEPPLGPLLVICPHAGRQWAETVYVQRQGLGLWRWGLRHVPPPADEPSAFAYLTL